MLNAKNLITGFGAGPVLNSVEFSARTGGITAIVGPSGAGKSTLLKALSGDLAYQGRITLNEIDIATAGPAELARVRAVLSQATPLAFPFTVIEVVRLGLFAARNADQIAEQALSRVGLRGFEGRFYQELSGGEAQRVQLARVLAQVWSPLDDAMPRWLFLDEPVSSLDIGHQLQIIRIAQDFAAQGGGVVMVMHDLNLTAMCADSVAVISAGRVLAQDRPDGAMSSAILSRAYGCELKVNATPATGVFVLPQVAGLPKRALMSR